ncbi:MAG: hypothetical protein Q8R92_12380, partial [Deltaproteobacteria bacterium]|nr:hypothetical protein [Deltaproteobacteria bacterium]
LDLVEEAPVMEAETLDLSEEISDETELLTELPEGEAVEDDGVALEGEDLPEALIEELTEEMPDLDIPMEPVREDADSDESLELIESGFQPIDFTTEVTELAERGNIEDEWEIVAVGSPTRLGPASFSIPLEIREAGHPVREAHITITLSGPSTKPR